MRRAVSSIVYLCAALFLFAGKGAVAQTWVQKIAGNGLGNPLAVNPKNSDIVYTAAGGSRIYVSRDRGYTWAYYGNPVDLGGIVKSIIINSYDTSIVVAGVETGSSTPDRVMRSTNGGGTWQFVWGGTYAYYGQPLEYDPTHPDTLYTMGKDTLWRSTNFGLTWDTVRIISGFNTWCDAAIRPDSSNILYIGDNASGIWRSSNYGAQWSLVYTTIGEIPSIAIDPFNPLTAYATKFGGGAGIVKTVDGGYTWHPLTVPSGNRDTWWITCSRIHPGYLYYGTYTIDTALGGIFISRDYGTSWERYRNGLPTAGLFNYGLLAVDSLTVIALQGNGVYRLQHNTSVTVLAPNGGEVFLVDDVDTIRWDANYLSLVKLEYSTNNGGSWSLIADSLPAGSGLYPWVIPATSSSSCLVKVSDALFTSTSDQSNSTFTITDTLLAITSPNGGEVWSVASTKSIRWTSVGLSTVTLEYSVDSAASWNYIATIPASLGSYSWIVPMGLSTGCKIRASGVMDSLVIDESDGFFEIQSESIFEGSFVIQNGPESDTLYFGATEGATDGIDSSLGEVELSPKPSPGEFDARWSITGSSGTLVDLRDTLAGLHDSSLYTTEFQPGSSGYPFSFLWNTDDLSSDVFILRDAATNGELYSADMKRSSSLVVDNPDVTSLEILRCKSTEIILPGSGGWALSSLPVTVGDRRTSSIFAYTPSGAYAFRGGYARLDTIQYGTGFWVKTENNPVIGCYRDHDTIVISAGWNIVGSISSPVAVAALTTQPDSILISNFFGYDNGYLIADSIIPGHGYWVKSSAGGKLIISAEPMATRKESVFTRKYQTITISDGGGSQQTLYFGAGETPQIEEMPPPSPEAHFSASFRGKNILEMHSRTLENDLEIPILLTALSRKIIFSWSVESEREFTYILVELVGTADVSETILTGKGSLALPLQAQSRFSIHVRRSAVVNPEVPHAFSLDEPYPNPFNPAVHIDYQVAAAARIQIVVYSVLGEIVATLVDERLDAGKYQAIWNGRRADGVSSSSGIYFVRMETTTTDGTSRSFMQQRKVLLIK